MKREILEWIFCIIIALILAMLFKIFIGVPTIVKHESMVPTLQENQRLMINRTFRITGNMPKVGDMITFEAPSKTYNELNKNQPNPVAVYDKQINGVLNKLLYHVFEVTKVSYIKRVIATEGQHVVIKDGKVYVDNQELKETYLSSDVRTESKIFNDFIVPEGTIFAMGDNREKSLDCRELGCIPLDKIEGIVIFRFWPLDEINKF